MANKFVPITDLPLLPGAPGLGQEMAIQASGVTYRVDARSFPLVTDMFVTWGGQTAALPGSRQIMQGTGIAIDTSTPGQIIINAVNNGTVTSVGLSAPTGFAVSGSPVNGAGTLALSYAPGYQGFTTLEAGLIASAVQPGDNISDLVNDVGYITGISGSDVIAALGYTPYDAANPNGYTDGATWGINLNSVPTIITDLGALANASGTLTNDGSGNLSWVPAAGTGTVTSVGLSVPSVFSVTGSPITTSGTLALSFAGGQTANHFLATPDGSPGAVSLRAIVSGDLPAINLASSGAGGVTGTLPDANLSSNVALKNATNTFTATNYFSSGGSNGGYIVPDATGVGLGYSSNYSAGGAVYVKSGGIDFYRAGTVSASMNSSGNWTINAPGSGTALTINSINDEWSINQHANGVNAGSYISSGAGSYVIGTSSAHTVAIRTNGVQRIETNAAGNVTINAPSSGATLSITSAAGASAFDITSANSSNNAVLTFTVPGIRAYQIGALADDNFLIRDISAGADRLRITSAGNVTINTPSSGTSLSIASSFNQLAIQMSDGTITGFLQPYGTGGEFAYGTTSNHPLTFYSNSALRGTIGNAGNWTIHAPSSGATMNVNAASSARGINILSASGGSDQAILSLTAAATREWQLLASRGNYFAIRDDSDGIDRLTLSANGNFSIASPSSGYPLYVEGDVRTHLPSGSNYTFRGYDFGILGDGTSYGNIGMNMTSGEMRHRAGFNGWGGTHTFYTDGDERFWITAAGNVGVNAPDSGNSLTVTGIDGNTGIRYNSNSVGVALGYVTGTTAFIGTVTSHQLNLLAGNATRVIIGTTGGIQFGSPTGGDKGAGTLNTAGQIYINNAAVGFKDVPRRTSSYAEGECTALTSGITLTSGQSPGQCFSFYNDSASPVTITQGGGVTLRLAGTNTTGNRTLAARGMCTVWVNSSSEYIIAGPGLT